MPFATEDAVGVTSIATSVMGATVSCADPVIPPRAAEIVVAPAPMALASPCEPAAFEMEAMAAFELAQDTCAVTSCVVESLNVPIAPNCCWPFVATVAAAGVTSMETRVAATTVSWAVLF